MSLVDEILTNEFFKKVLEKKIENFKDVLKINASDVVTVGEGLSSDFLRVRVTYCTTLRDNKEVVSVIVKILKMNEEMSKDLMVHENESSFYGEIFPLMTKLGFGIKFGPKIYLISGYPRSMIIMEDMSALGYNMHSRQEGLDLEHCLVVLKKLAAFHASSVVLQKNNPELLNKFNRDPGSKENILKAFLRVAQPELLRVLSNVQGLQKYIKKIPSVEKIYQNIYAAEAGSTNFIVLNHGDFWCNNILFQYKPNGEVNDAVFVDYQLSYLASPCMDLHYFFGTSVKTRDKVKTINTTLNYYFDELLSNLEKFNVDSVPTHKQLCEDFRKRAMHGFGALCLIAPLIRAGNLEDTTIKMFLEEEGKDTFRYRCFNSPQYLEELQQLLPFYDNLGAFD
ncbi:hypothetical protein FQA39_LY02851 [Lamprigera yunnana]|nr:hypothetical protein FQA39_LY02851 [Lamprigera yunnana]